MVSGGQNQKPAALKILHGTHRSDRQPRQKVKPAGRPSKPRGIDKEASRHWDLIVKERALWISRSDQPALTAVCELWALSREALAAFKAKPTDFRLRANYLALLGEWHRQASRFGLTPVDRERLGSTVESNSRAKLEEKYLG